MDPEQKRLAFIILDIVAILAILSVVLMDDLSRGYEKSEFQKLITGGAQWTEQDMCGAIKCGGTLRAKWIGDDHKGYTICKCPDGRAYSIQRFAGSPETVLNQD